MPTREAKRLFKILDECTFQPALQTSENTLPGNERHELHQVKDMLAQQREHFRNCMSDEEVYEAYHEQLGSEEANKFNHRLRELKLPTLEDCREQFETAASTLFDKGVRKHSRLP